ncbi:hypothetical protein R3P38DRAFT_3176575 [Favolaschia claudopus]|uniref:Uncharacterized protein n=1 Tax=Favolaschia claudopus TaxID=2862362 RepID=A0AAW0D0F5_9AGAR
MPEAAGSTVRFLPISTRLCAVLMSSYIVPRVPARIVYLCLDTSLRNCIHLALLMLARFASVTDLQAALHAAMSRAIALPRRAVERVNEVAGWNERTPRGAQMDVKVKSEGKRASRPQMLEYDIAYVTYDAVLFQTAP